MTCLGVNHFGKTKVVSRKCLSSHASKRNFTSGVYSFGHPSTEDWPVRTNDCSSVLMYPTSINSDWKIVLFLRKFSMLRWSARRLTSSPLISFSKNTAIFSITAAKSWVLQRVLESGCWAYKKYLLPFSFPRRKWIEHSVYGDYSILRECAPNKVPRALQMEVFSQNNIHSIINTM